MLSGQPSVTVKVVADAKGQRRPAVTLTASHQATTFVPANATFVQANQAFPGHGAFLSSTGGYALPAGYAMASSSGFAHPTACFITPAVCFAPQTNFQQGAAGGYVSNNSTGSATTMPMQANMAGDGSANDGGEGALPEQEQDSAV